MTPTKDRDSILNISSSVLKHFGVHCGHPSMEETDNLFSGRKKIILVLLDGLGIETLNSCLDDDDFLKTNLCRRISSVFPPTTAAAATSVLTGMSPCEHGWIGGFIRDPETGVNVSVFDNRIQNTDTVIPGPRVADSKMPYSDICRKIREESHIKAEIVSPVFGTVCADLDTACDKALELISGEESAFVYIYWDEPDRAMHIYGTESKEAAAAVAGINGSLERMCRKLPENTAVAITADHGLTDTYWVNLGDYPEISGLLENAPSLERRMVSFKVKEGTAALFKERFNNLFSDRFRLFSAQEIIESGLLGDGEMNEMIPFMLGDFIAVATGEFSFALEDEDLQMKACHAGMTDREMYVPLILFAK